MRIAIMVRKMAGKGGMETVIRTVFKAAGQDPRPLEMEVWAFGRPETAEWLDGIPHRIANIDQGTGRRFQLGTKLPLYTWAIRRFLKAFPADCLLATDPVFVRAGITAGHRKVFSWLHFSLDRMANRRYLAPAAGHLAISSQIAEQIEALTPRHAPSLVGNPLPAVPDRLIPPPDGSCPRFVYVGRLMNHQKRLDVLLRALQGLGDQPGKLLVVGDGPDRRMLMELAEHLNVASRVTWAGWHDDPWGAVPAATAVVLTSDFEGFAMVLLEALARGVPVVATDCPAGPRDIVRPGRNGWLVPPGDPGAVTQALQHFVGQQDGGLAMTAEERKLDAVARFAASTVWARIRSVLEA